MEALDSSAKKPHERSSIGVLLCATKDDEVRIINKGTRQWANLFFDLRFAVNPLESAATILICALSDLNFDGGSFGRIANRLTPWLISANVSPLAPLRCKSLNS
jgi:hypothetical protein